MIGRRKVIIELAKIIEDLVDAVESLRDRKADKEQDSSDRVFGSYYGVTQAKARLQNLLGQLGVKYEDY